MRFRGRLQTYEQQPHVQPAEPAAAPISPTEQGYLLIQVSTAQGAIPIAGAAIVISEGSNVLYNVNTDNAGKSIAMSIDAPNSALSQRPGNSRPYSVCDATIYSPGYYTNIYRNIQIFPQTTSLQNVFLIPLPEDKRNERLTQVYDASPHSLYQEGAE